MKKKALVSVIIPTYNEERDIKHCLESLQQQIYKDFEIIVVDDGSSDKTREIVRAFKQVSLFEGKHEGPGVSRNWGAEKARGDILIFVDADMTFEKDYIKNLVTPIRENEQVTGTTHDYEIATNMSNYISKLWGEVRLTKEQAKNAKVFRAIKKEAFLRFGGFDKKYGYADDQTFWFKYHIQPEVAQNTLCYHKNPESLKDTYKQARWIGASWKERFPIFTLPAVNYIAVFLAFFVYPGAVMLKSLKKNPGASFKERFLFYSAKFWGYLIGLCRVIFLKKVSK